MDGDPGSLLPVRRIVSMYGALYARKSSMIPVVLLSLYTSPESPLPLSGDQSSLLQLTARCPLSAVFSFLFFSFLFLFFFFAQRTRKKRKSAMAVSEVQSEVAVLQLNG